MSAKNDFYSVRVNNNTAILRLADVLSSAVLNRLVTTVKFVTDATVRS